MYFKQRLHRKLLCILLAGVSSQMTYASSVYNQYPDNLFSNSLASFFSTYVVTLSGGAAWENASNSQTMNLTPTILKTYSANNSSQTLADGELFFGVQKPINTKLQGQIGLALAATSAAKFSGNIWDDANPQFNNYTYNYQVSHVHVAVKGKLLADMGYAIIPWISASAGVGFNDAYQYNSTPLLFQAVQTPNFTSNTTTAFTYTLGIGVQRALNKNWQAGIGYEFADWGKSQLGSASGQTVGSGLSLDHLYTNSVLLNLTYLA